MRTYSRRDLLTAGSTDQHHVSSAIVLTLPENREAVSRNLAGMQGVEIHAGEASRIVITIEGPSSGFLGETLTRISLMDGVLAANMVFEQADRPEVGT